MASTTVSRRLLIPTRPADSGVWMRRDLRLRLLPFSALVAGGWAWTDVLVTALVGLPLGLAFRLLPGPPSLLGVSLAHVGATCGYLGPGPWLLHRLGLL